MKISIVKTAVLFTIVIYPYDNIKILNFQTIAV